MERLSTRLPAETLADLEARAERGGVSPAAAARECIESVLADARGPSADERIAAVRAEYEAQISDLETDLERARRARRAANERAEDIGELARTREREQSLAERRARAGLGKKLRWAVFGMGDE